MSQLPGAFSPYTCKITPEIQATFTDATERIMGVNYEAVAFAQQIVNGTNYSFLANATPVYPNASTFGVILTIYQPLEGKPHIVSISKI